MSDIKFGTDGWRGRIGEDYTFANVRRCTQGYADYLKAEGRTGKIVVGHDRRFLAEHFAVAAAEVLAGNGFTVFLTDTATPTPVISFSVGAKGAVAAVNITASHNPPEDCGFKVRDEHGGAVDPRRIGADRIADPRSRRYGRHPPRAVGRSLGRRAHRSTSTPSPPTCNGWLN